MWQSQVQLWLIHVSTGSIFKLIAANHTVEETRDIIGADSLTYLSIDGLIDSIGIDTDAPNGGLCVAYFDGKYPTPLYDYEERYVESLKEHTSFY